MIMSIADPNERRWLAKEIRHPHQKKNKNKKIII